MRREFGIAHGLHPETISALVVKIKLLEFGVVAIILPMLFALQQWKKVILEQFDVASGLRMVK
jgi:hypothetical protein